jgi:hypothetical protein
MNKILTSLSLAVLAITLAAPLAAQTVTLKADIPFDFMVAGRTMPAGEYVFATLGSVAVWSVTSESRTRAALVLTAPGNGAAQAGTARVEFNRYGNEYFLSGVSDGISSHSRIIPMSRQERELSNRAAISRPDSVMILASR